MAEHKVIHSAIRVDETKKKGEGKDAKEEHVSKLYLPGMEEELAKEFPDKLKDLSESGAISGFGHDPKPKHEAKEEKEK